MKKKVLIMSDMHCGHKVGLTPAKYDSIPTGASAHEHKLYAIRREIWRWYVKTCDVVRPDIVIHNGDAIDGSGKKSGGRELISVDISDQVAMAVECIKETRAKKVFMTYGTGYHTGSTRDNEYEIAHKLGAKIGSHEWISINGLVFDCKHKIGGSSIPHGKGTSLLKDKLWNELWALHDEQPKADVLIRSHVHYYIAIDETDTIAIITPALQGMGSIYGTRQCSGRVEVGLLEFEIDDDGTYEWRKHIAKLKSQKATVTVA